jgi:transposase
MTDKHERRPAGYLVEGTFLVELPADAPPEAVAFERDDKRFGWKSGRAVQFEVEDGRAVTAPYALDDPSGAAIVMPHDLDPAAMPAVAVNPPPAAIDPTAALAVAAEQRIDPAAVLALDPLAGMSAADMPVNLSAAVAAGRQLALDIKHIRERLDPEQVAGLATTIEAEFGPMFADDLPNAIEFEVVVTPDDADTPEAIAAEQASAQAIAAEVQHILRTNRYEIVRNAADADFWRAFAADVLAHAWAWAVEDARGDHIEQLDTMTDAESEAAVERIYADSAGIEQAIAVLDWGCQRLAARGMTMLVLIWDNAAWHVSKAVRTWLRDHNQQVHREGGVRIVPCFLPTKSPWLNPIEPTWVHGKRRIAEPARLLTAQELESRVCAAFACSLDEHLVMLQEVA